MGIKDLSHSLTLALVDKISSPANKLGAVSKRLAKNIIQTKGAIKDLNQQSKNLEHLGNLNKKLGTTGQQADTSRKKLDSLWREFNEAKTAGKSTKRLAKSISATKRKIDDLSTSQKKLKSESSSLRRELRNQGVDTRNLGKAEDVLTKKTAKLNAKLKDQSKKIGMVKKAGELLGNTWKKIKGISLAGAIGMASLAAPTLTVAANFEESMSTVGAITQSTGKDFVALRDTARDLGKSTSFSASEAAQGMRFLGMAGFKTNQIIAAMPGVLSLAKAGATDLGAAADISSDILSGFGLNAKEMPRVADVLTKTFTTSNTTLEMLGESMKHVAPIARKFGMSIEEAAAMTGLLGNVGIKGSQAGTTLRAMLTRLAAPAGAAADTLKELGIQTRAADGNMRNIIDIVGDLGKATKRMGTGQQLEIIKTIFGEEPAAGVAELLTQGQLGISKYTETLKNAGGTTDRVAKQMGDNTKGGLKQWKSAIEDISITVGDVFLPALTEIVKSLTHVTREFGTWAAAHPELIKTLGIVTAGAIALVAGLGLIGTVAPAVVIGLNLMKVALLTNPIGLTITAIAAGAALIWTNWEKLPVKFRTIGTQIMAGLKDGIMSGFNWVKEKMLMLGDLMPNWFKDKLGIRSPSKVFATLGGNVAEGVGVGIKGKTHVAVNAVKSMGAKLPGALPSALAMSLIAGGANAQPSYVSGGRTPSGSTSQQVIIHQKNEFNIYPSSTMDEQKFARHVAIEIDKINRKTATQNRSALHDEL